jgi:hypothetical protein
MGYWLGVRGYGLLSFEGLWVMGYWLLVMEFLRVIG